MIRKGRHEQNSEAYPTPCFFFEQASVWTLSRVFAPAVKVSQICKPQSRLKLAVKYSCNKPERLYKLWVCARVPSVVAPRRTALLPLRTVSVDGASITPVSRLTCPTARRLSVAVVRRETFRACALRLVAARARSFARVCVNSYNESLLLRQCAVSLAWRPACANAPSPCSLVPACARFDVRVCRRSDRCNRRVSLASLRSRSLPPTEEPARACLQGAHR